MKEHFDLDSSIKEQIIKVFCAWCNNYLYSVSTPSYKETYSNSHGICKDCMKKYFHDLDD